MAKGDKKNPGLIHGKHGNLIGRVRDGIQTFTGLYRPTNPRTTEQQKHRMKLAFVNRLSKVLEEAVNRGFALVPKSDSGQTARNAFVHENFHNGAIVWDEEMGEWGLRPELLTLAMGPRYIGMGMKAEVRNGQLYILVVPTQG